MRCEMEITSGKDLEEKLRRALEKIFDCGSDVVAFYESVIGINLKR